MDRNDLMKAVAERAFDARIGLHALCRKANVSGTVITRWNKGEAIPSLPTIDKLETALAQVEAARA